MYHRYVTFIISIIVASCLTTITAQDDVMSINNEFIKDKYYFLDSYGDTALMNIISDITIYPPMHFKNKRRERFYWRTVRDVQITLPYAKMIYRTLVETYEYIETFPTQEEREAYLNSMEHEIFEQYKPQLKRLSLRQGKLLIRLINRETNQSSYDIIKAFLGSFRAGFWQTFGRFFGANLKSEWNPEKNSDDALIDRICTQIEQGGVI